MIRPILLLNGCDCKGQQTFCFRCFCFLLLFPQLGSTWRRSLADSSPPSTRGWESWDKASSMEKECGFLKQSINGSHILHPQLARKWDFATHGPAAPTSAPSIGCLLLLGCGGWMNFNWVYIWFHLGNQFYRKYLGLIYR